MGHEIMGPRERVVAGIMSGTSIDGVDVAIARIAGSGREAEIVLQGYYCAPYDETLREQLMDAATARYFPVTLLSQLNVRVAHAYADAVRHAMRQFSVSRLDLIGSHGQTVRHVPDAAEYAGMRITSTLQIGDPSVLANLLGTPVVGDFRLADMAAGGQGAPLAPYFDHVVFGHDRETRMLLNVGGIANLTVLPRGSDSVYGFDTGSGNMVMDTLSRRLLGVPFDRDGQVAGQGKQSEPVLNTLMQDAYYHANPPKSTGRERYGPAYMHRFLALCRDLSTEDTMATATALAARTIWHGYDWFVHPYHRADRLIISGGGRHNRTLMRMLQEHFISVPITSSDDHGINGDAKEALCFALLAHETMNGKPANMPGATGAQHGVLLGKICLPP